MHCFVAKILKQGPNGKNILSVQVLYIEGELRASFKRKNKQGHQNNTEN